MKKDKHSYSLKSFRNDKAGAKKLQVLLARLSVTFAEIHRLNDIIKTYYSTK